MREACLRMIALARASGARVIVAGSDATDAPEPYLQAGAEIALRGEGLDTLAGLVKRLDADLGIDTDALADGMGGIARLEGGRVSCSDELRAPGLVPQPDLPAWDLVDIERYRAVWLKAHGYFSLNMAASRGCPFRCSWCAKPIWGNQYAQRSAESVAAEFTYLKHRFNPDHIWFADDIFGFRPAWVMRFAHAVREANARVPFTIQTRADLTTEAMAEALKEAGCAEAWLGAESGSQRILDAMHKGTTVPEIKTARARLKAHGIRVGFFIQLGYIGEQLDDILATRELLESARPDDVGVSVAYPLPGTKFFEQVQGQFLNGKRHWKDSGDLAMMFRGTYSSDFYRAIRDLLHEQVNLARSDGAGSGLEENLASRWADLERSEGRFRVTPVAT
jgi:anaerobic magnesium-protoporphyrin IX monomethyl ester cyclase